MKTAAVVADFGKHKTNDCTTSINLRTDNPYNESRYTHTVRAAATWRRYDYPWTDQRLAFIQRHKNRKVTKRGAELNEHLPNPKAFRVQIYKMWQKQIPENLVPSKRNSHKSRGMRLKPITIYSDTAIRPEPSCCTFGHSRGTKTGHCSVLVARFCRFTSCNFAMLSVTQDLYSVRWLNGI